MCVCVCLCLSPIGFPAAAAAAASEGTAARVTADVLCGVLLILREAISDVCFIPLAVGGYWTFPSSDSRLVSTAAAAESSTQSARRASTERFLRISFRGFCFIVVLPAPSAAPSIA